jgi:hypothetical protein
MRCFLASLLLALALFVSACSSDNDNMHTTATTYVTPAPTQILNLVPRPVWIETLISDQSNQASPVVSILSPLENENLPANTISVKLSLRGDLPIYRFQNAAAAGSIVGALTTGDHLHLVLDNLPAQECFDPTKPITFHDLSPGRHTLRVFAARPWHESYKNASAFQMVVFNVAGPKDKNVRVNDTAIADPARPVLTYSSPNDEFKNDSAASGLIVSHNLPAAKTEGPEPVMIDFWLSNAKLKGDGGDYRVRYFVDDDDARYIDKWAPIWLSGWTPGKHSVRVELLGADQYPVPGGITTREITVIK